MYTFLDLINQVKRSATKDQSGTQFDQWVKDTINYALFTLSRECPWKKMRRTNTFETVGEYSTGTVSVTAATKSLTFSGANIITAGVQIGRRITLSGNSGAFTIDSITGENAATVTDAVPTAVTAGTYTILGQEEYNLPWLVGRPRLIWHEQFGYPFPLNFITDFEFFKSNPELNFGTTPTHYREWGSNTVINQPRSASVIRIASSSSSDTSIAVTVFGTVSGYPDYEIITTDSSNGTTAVSGSKSFTYVDRIVKGSTSVGRITLDANSAATTIAVLPVGDTVGSLEYKKIQLYPIPDAVFPINILYYKDPVRLVNDGDIHDLGFEFDDAIVLLATSRIKYDQSQLEDGDKFFALYTKQLNTLRRKNADNLGWIPTQLSPRDRMVDNRLHRNLSFSQIGSGWYGPMGR